MKNQIIKQIEEVASNNKMVSIKRKELPDNIQRHLNLLDHLDNQIGCGYCHVENECEKRDGKTNFAKLGCKEFKQYKSE